MGLQLSPVELEQNDERVAVVPGYHHTSIVRKPAVLLSRERVPAIWSTRVFHLYYVSEHAL